MDSDFLIGLSLNPFQVLFYISPVNKLVGALMTVLSLFPGKRVTVSTLSVG